MKSDKKVLLNVITSLFLQVVLVINGFILPRLLLSFFGSDVNGLVSSLNQFLGYIQLVEGGLSGVILSTLYNPLANKDFDRVNTIVNTARSFFRKIGIAYIIYAIAVGIIYPIIVKSQFSFTFVFLLTIILTVSLFSQYYFSLPYRLLLQADQKLYVVSISQIIITIINLILAILSLKIYPSVHILKLLNGIMYFLQPLIFWRYTQKHYDLDKNAKLDNAALEQRWDGFGQNLAYFIHTNTDAIVISLFLTLKDVSVYAVYFLVVNSLKNLIIAVSNGIIPTLGIKMNSQKKEDFGKSFELYEFIMFSISTIVYSCAIILIVPFVMLYTKGVNDANYYHPIFGVILILAEMIYCLRDPYVSITYAAGHFKQTSKYAYIEAFLNILISIILVNYIGIMGVALGTLISMLYRLFFQIIYASKNFINRKSVIALKNLIVFMICPAIAICIYRYFINIKHLNQIIICGFVFFAFFSIITVIIGFIAYRPIIEGLFHRLLNKKSNKGKN